MVGGIWIPQGGSLFDVRVTVNCSVAAFLRYAYEEKMCKYMFAAKLRHACLTTFFVLVDTWHT